MIMMFSLISQVGRSHEAAERRLRELQVARDSMMMMMMMTMMMIGLTILVMVMTMKIMMM